MANYNENIVDIELTGGNIHRSFLNHSIGAGDKAANRFGVRVFRNGEEVQLSGTCMGLFVRQTGDTVTITGGVISGNTAYVTLPESCYAVEGNFTLAIKVTSSDETVTLRIVDGVVSRTSTDTNVDPGNILPSIADLIEALENAEALVPPDSTVLNTITKMVKEESTWVSLPFTVTSGKYIKYNDGTEVASSGAGATDYIPISMFRLIRYKQRNSGTSSRNSGIAFYNSAKTYISGTIDAYSTSQPVGYLSTLNMNGVPANAAYVRCTVYTDTTTYGNFTIEGQNEIKVAQDKDQNAIEGISDVLFEQTSSVDISTWTIGGINIPNGANTDNTAYVRCDYVKVRAGSTINVDDGYKFAVGMWTLDDNPTYISGKSAFMTGEYIVPQDCRIKVAIAKNDDSTQTDTSIKSHVKWNLYRMPIIVTTKEEFDDAVKYSIDTTHIGYSFGGLNTNGASTNNTKRIRLLTPDGMGGFKVGKGSTITAETGYTFAVALYSSYVNASNYEQIGWRANAGGSYTVPEDCYIRIAIGTSNNDVLWTQDSQGAKSFTTAGNAAKTALTLVLYGGTVKDEIDNLQAAIGAGSIFDMAIELTDEIPLNAVAFHELFDDLVDEGSLARTLIGKVNNSNDYPVYMYVLRHDMDHLASDYSRVTWDGTNQLYNRPKVFLNSGLHGNERTTPFALYDFIRKLCTNTSYQQMRNGFDWYFLPLANPWGFSNTAYLTSTGTMNDGSGYTDTTKNNYTIIANSSSAHQGIRRNYDGIDINRDFGNFATSEAQFVRSALQSITGGGRSIAFAIDSHQAAYGTDVNAIGAFMSMDYGATQDIKAKVWNTFMQAGAKTEKIMADYCDVENVQSIYAWDGTDAATLRNYLVNYANYAMCFEGGQTCIYYSGSSSWSNSIARTLINTQYHGFLHLLSEQMIKEHSPFFSLLTTTTATTTETTYNTYSGRRFTDFLFMVFILRNADATGFVATEILPKSHWLSGRSITLLGHHGANLTSVSGVEIKFNNDTSVNAKAIGAGEYTKFEIVGIKKLG